MTSPVVGRPAPGTAMSPPAGGPGSPSKHGAVTITLHTSKEDTDEKAEVKVQLANPDAVVETMLRTLAQKFPPESVMTISSAVADHHGGHSEDGSSAGTTDTGRGGHVDSSAMGDASRNPTRLPGRHYPGPNGEYYPGLTDSKGRPMAGRPVVQHVPVYETLDGRKLPVAVDPQTGRIIDGYVNDPVDGSPKPVGPPAHFDALGNPVPGFINLNGATVPGIVVKMDMSPAFDQSGSSPHAAGQHGINSNRPNQHFPPLSPQDSHPNYPGPQKYPGHIEQSGYPSPQRYPGQNYPSQLPYPTGPQHFPGPNMSGGALGSPQHYPSSGDTSPRRVVRIPAPSYPLYNGSYALLAVGPDGRPMDGHCHEPSTGNIVRVGQPYYDPVTGTPVPGYIIDPETGRPTPGEPLAPHGWHLTSNQPLPHYLTTSQVWVPMHIDEEGRLVHGFATDVAAGGVPRPVGLQAVDKDGNAIPGVIVSPDGRRRHGWALCTLESDGSYVSKPDASRPGTSTTTMVRETSEVLGEVPPETSIRYVEVPVVEERIVRVKKQVIQEVEKRVPKVQVAEVEKIVEVPQIEYVDRYVEVPKIEEVVREVPVRQVVDRPYEVLVHMPRVETKIVEKLVEVPGPIVEVPRVQQIENAVYVPHYVDQEVPTVVAQKLQPVVHNTRETQRVPCRITEPKIITVDVFIPKPVQSTVVPIGKSGETHRAVDIPVAQYNALLRRLNENIEQSHIDALLVHEGAGVPILPAGERVETVEPVVSPSEWRRSHTPGKIRCIIGH